VEKKERKEVMNKQLISRKYNGNAELFKDVDIR
jgi:hypothetical protein